MNLNDAANKLFLAGHKGRHTVAYHQYVLQRLETAIKSLKGNEYVQALKTELNMLKTELTKNPEIVKMKNK